MREEEDFGGGVGGVPEGGEDEDDVCICTIVPHELESVEEGDEEHLEK